MVLYVVHIYGADEANFSRFPRTEHGLGRWEVGTGKETRFQLVSTGAIRRGQMFSKGFEVFRRCADQTTGWSSVMTSRKLSSGTHNLFTV